MRSLTSLALSLTFSLSSANSNTTGSSCQHACTVLSSLLPGRVSLPASAVYIHEEQYWSQQQASVTPRCRVSPNSTGEIATIMKTLAHGSCPFTVKGGGHTPFAGGSNIQDGITIDMVNLTSVTVSKDKSTVSVGPGARWINVYQKLDPLNLTVVGGRVSDVGVSGLTLGGGISAFSARYGWACDNVNAYEVVLANGTVVTATPKAYPDLYKALRGGGGSNFGIVSRFDFAAIKQGDLWGGERFYNMSLNSTLLQGFTDYNINNPTDLNAHFILPFVYQTLLGGWAGLGIFYYALPTPEPPIYKNFTALPSLISTTRISNVSSFALELNVGEGPGKRQIYRTMSFKNDYATAQALLDLCVKQFTPFLALADGGTTCAFQPQPIDYEVAMEKNGGNVLGLDPAGGPRVVLNMNFQYTDAAHDAVLFQAAQTFITDARALARKMGTFDEFIYMNYAGPDQDVQAGYGVENLAFLKKTARKYDPEALLQRNWPGYHKVGTA